MKQRFQLLLVVVVAGILLEACHREGCAAFVGRIPRQHQKPEEFYRAGVGPKHCQSISDTFYTAIEQPPSSNGDFQAGSKA